jgi:hypothetical protein
MTFDERIFAIANHHFQRILLGYVQMWLVKHEIKYKDLQLLLHSNYDPLEVWKLVYVDYQTKYLDCMFVKETLKDHLHNTLK